MALRETQHTAETDLFRQELINLINLRHPLVQLGDRIDWAGCEQRFGGLYASGVGRPGHPIRLMVGLQLPWAVGRNNWLFAGSFAAADRAADIMSLIQSAKLNDIDPMAYLSDVLARLPTHPNSRIAELLPTQWRPTAPTSA